MPQHTTHRQTATLQNAAITIPKNSKIINRSQHTNLNGEVYADHETAAHTGEDTFISHYNNQYNAVSGVGKQYTLTEDHRWFQLTSNLTAHIMPMDIPKQDRIEYNNASFGKRITTRKRKQSLQIASNRGQHETNVDN